MTVETLLVAALRGEVLAWPPAVSADEVVRASIDQGVAPLIAGAGAIDRWPEAARAPLRDALRLEAARDAAIQPEIARVVGALHTAGVPSLLMKGAPLAYTHYPRPWFRPRADTDLLVTDADRPLVDDRLRNLGYEPVTGFSGALVTHQYQYARAAAAGVVHYVDVHWRIANPQLFSTTLGFEELRSAGVPVPALGDAARGLSDVHALALACLHRVAHHGGSTRLIWLYDIHLLARGLDDAGRAALEAVARARGLLAVCASSIQEARARFATPVPDGWLEDLLRRGRGEPTAAFMLGARTKFDVLRSDLAALPGWRARVRLIREHLFPPADYLRRTHRVPHPWLLPLVYAWRIVAGARRWFR